MLAVSALASGFAEDKINSQIITTIITTHMFGKVLPRIFIPAMFKLEVIGPECNAGHSHEDDTDVIDRDPNMSTRFMTMDVVICRLAHLNHIIKKEEEVCSSVVKKTRKSVVVWTTKNKKKLYELLLLLMEMAASSIKTFDGRRNLSRHRMNHTTENSHHCAVCDRCFLRLQHLKVHQRTHSGEKPHYCSACGKGFTKGRLLRTQQQLHAIEGADVGTY
ncbi:hypothetical protein DPEC_G00169040 [Dallia pectoralis]|uniref:Uncharacterized protein n=1 Tax=Dallia pectoralis TaxID=75939 RepID=A0ACC2GCX9_DALPE|nr:hypothetical protein DPEC_G00169040 [Dallia pectoralis]